MSLCWSLLIHLTFNSSLFAGASDPRFRVFASHHHFGSSLYLLGLWLEAISPLSLLVAHSKMLTLVICQIQFHFTLKVAAAAAVSGQRGLCSHRPASCFHR